MDIKVLRATEYWEKAGASYVRIHAMARTYEIPLHVEFDDIDADPDTKHIVLLDDIYPIATCRMFEEEKGILHIGRVIVIPEYRKRGLGRRVVEEAEKWAVDLGYHKMILDSRDVAVQFYKKMDYVADYDNAFFDTFQCIPMSKDLKKKRIFVQAEILEADKIIDFYYNMIDKLEGNPYHPKWQKDIYPTRDYLRQAIEAGTLYYVMEDGCILGAMICDHHYNESYNDYQWPTQVEADEIMVIHTLVVDSDHYRKGVGTAMVQYAIDLARDTKQKVVRLDVIEGNLAADQLYQCFGFQYLHTLPMYYEDTGWMNFRLYEYEL